MRGFIVVGAESTGTRLVTKILINMGCAGWDGHFQPFDKEPFGSTDLVVWRRSVPHSGQWLQLPFLVTRLREAKREVHVVVTVRDWAITAASQVRNKHAVTIPQAEEKIHGRS
jgi:LPS sulfotransferase NodH